MKRKVTPKTEKNGQLTPDELKAWRKRMGWSQERAAEHLGFSVHAYRHWEYGLRVAQQPVAIRKLMAIARPPR